MGYDKGLLIILQQNSEYSRQKRGDNVVVTRYMNGKEITQDSLKKIKLTDNPQILQLIDHIVTRVNESADKQVISTKDVPA